jgi:hypothetical protein
VSGVLAYQGVRLRSALADAQRLSATLSHRAHDLERQITDQRAAGAATVEEPKGLPTSQAGPPQDTASDPSATPPENAFRGLPTIAIVLLPQARAIGPIATLAVPRSVDRVPFELRLESHDFPRYRVTLRDPGTDHILWRSDTLTARVADTVPRIPIVVPAGLLEGQHYSLELEGFRGSGGTEVVGSYAFQVVRR